MFRQRSTRVVLGALCLVLALSACRFQAYGNAPVEASADSGVAWLKTQQQPDGGFEVSGFPGFETPDAVLAIATVACESTTADTSIVVVSFTAFAKPHQLPLKLLNSASGWAIAADSPALRWMNSAGGQGGMGGMMRGGQGGQGRQRGQGGAPGGQPAPAPGGANF